MDKFDSHGFYTREWASANIDGFDQLGSCCQQEVLLFPEMPIPCLLRREPEFNPDPLAVDPLMVSKPASYGGAGGAALLGLPFLPDGGGGSYHSGVPSPATGGLLLTALVAILIARRIRT